MLRALLGGLIGGAIGAAVWAAIALLFDYQISIVAWGIGALVGVGVNVGGRSIGGVNMGVMAAIIAIGSITVGKYIAVSIFVDRITSAVGSDEGIAEALDGFTDEDARVYMAHSLVREGEKNGIVYTWHEGMTSDDAEEPADFPKQIWPDVEARWKGMNADTQAKYVADAKAATAEEIREGMHEFSAAAKSVGFASTYSYRDIIWSLLAIISAYRLGSGGE